MSHRPHARVRVIPQALEGGQVPNAAAGGTTRQSGQRAPPDPNIGVEQERGEQLGRVVTTTLERRRDRLAKRRARAVGGVGEHA